MSSTKNNESFDSYIVDLISFVDANLSQMTPFGPKVTCLLKCIAHLPLGNKFARGYYSSTIQHRTTAGVKVSDYEYIEPATLTEETFNDLMYNIRSYILQGVLNESSLIKAVVYLQEYELLKSKPAAQQAPPTRGSDESPSSSLIVDRRYILLKQQQRRSRGKY